MKEYYIKTGKENMQLPEVKKLLEQSYWANERSIETIEKSMQYSICIGVFLRENDRQIGFARVLTDYATTYYICDVIVDTNHRGNGIGKNIMETIEGMPEIRGLRGMLATKDAHGLYRKYGFQDGGTTYMSKQRNKL